MRKDPSEGLIRDAAIKISDKTMAHLPIVVTAILAVTNFALVLMVFILLVNLGK